MEPHTDGHVAGREDVAYRVRAERAARGKARRAQVPRSSQAELSLEGRPDPIALLEEQAKTRLPELVPVRNGRMLSSPFAFFRGASLVMAADLARTPTTGMGVQLCGDAHLVNFGCFGTPERNLIFDLNDFDETLPGPWEWDVKRLAASFEIAGRSTGMSALERRAAVLATVRAYREATTELAMKPNLDVWYARLDVEALINENHLLERPQQKVCERMQQKAFEHDSSHALDKLTQLVDGDRRIVSDPPLIIPLRELVGDAMSHRHEDSLRDMLATYSASLASHRRALFGQFRMIEAARKVVGVGSVGTRCWILLFLSVDWQAPLFLQAKQADPSVLERFLGASSCASHGERVVSGQRLMQAASDMFLGWGTAIGLDGVRRDFYVRQLRDWKGSMAVEKMNAAGLAAYGRMCGWTLARAHARSGDRIAMSAYLGKRDIFDEAVATFAQRYADQNERDHQALAQAVRSGRVAAEVGL